MVLLITNSVADIENAGLYHRQEGNTIEASEELIVPLIIWILIGLVCVSSPLAFLQKLSLEAAGRRK